MFKRSLFYLFTVLLIALMVVGCAPAPAPTAAPVAAKEAATAVPPTAVPPTTVPPTAVPPTAAPKATEPAAQLTGDKNRLLLATTTSTQDSGLLKVILPEFEKEYNVKVDVVAVGTGQAIKLGEDGNADVLLVHARAQEDAFMKAGHGTRREDVMYNDFIILGPTKDPAGIKGMKSAADAFKKIADAKAPFISRGDKSGTNTKELAIWQTAGIEPKGDWYIAAGQGMGAVLTMAEEQQAYTLSDRATYLARTVKGIKLDILVEGEKSLLNPYGVITVNPAKNSKINADLATKFLEWIISVPTQEKIQAFGVEGVKQPLFFPDSAPWKAAKGTGGEAKSGAAADVALKVTGKVNTELALSEAEVKAMPTMETESKNKEGVASKYTGVSLKALLEKAGVKSDATKVVFVADDGFTAETTLKEVQGCEKCIISFREKGGFSTVMPDFSGKLQVKGVVEIQVQ
jgi:tungstate transport system substrate-binding protein